MASETHRSVPLTHYSFITFTNSIFKKIKDRKNVLLLGDSLGDIGMITGFDYDNLIKIGFLNENVKENVEYYKRNYDAIILNDSSMDFINKLLKKIIEQR